MNRRSFLAALVAAPVVALVRDSEPEFATGGYVDRTRLALVHPGENIVPAPGTIIRAFEHPCAPYTYPMRGGAFVPAYEVDLQTGRALVEARESGAPIAEWRTVETPGGGHATIAFSAVQVDAIVIRAPAGYRRFLPAALPALVRLEPAEVA